VGHLICLSAFVAMAITEFTGMPIEAHKKPLDHHTLKRAPSRLLPSDMKQQLHSRREAQKRLARATASAAAPSSLTRLLPWRLRRIAPAPDVALPPVSASASRDNLTVGERLSRSRDSAGGAPHATPRGAVQRRKR